MADDLYLRLCQVNEEDGGLPGAGKSEGETGYDPTTTHIATHDFIGALISILGGRFSVTDVETIYNMPVEQRTLFEAVWAKIIGAPSFPKQLARIWLIQAILLFWERKEELNLPQVNTPEDVQTLIETIDSTFT